MSGPAKWGLLGAVAIAGVALAIGRFAPEGPGPRAHAAPTPGAKTAQTSDAGEKGEAKIEPRADKELRRMSQYLGSLQTFSFKAESVDEVVLKSGEKLQYPSSSEVYVRRPNGLRSNRVGAVKLSLYYDGSAITLYGHEKKLYATAKAPESLDEAITFARETLSLEAPGADLLFSDPYAILTEDVVSGRYVGMATVDGQAVHHLAFEGNQSDWQIWIEDSKTPLPRRFVITSKHVLSCPQYTVSLSDWNTSPRLTNRSFEFQPPSGAKEISFDEVWERVRAELDRQGGQTAQRGAMK